MEEKVTILRKDANVIIAYLYALKNKTSNQKIKYDIDLKIESLKSDQK